LIERAKSMRDAGYTNKALDDLDAALKLDTSQAIKTEINNLKKTIR
jgi:hypothetical protein